MQFFSFNREWEVKNINNSCYNKVYGTERCILQYNIDIERFSSLYYSCVIIPAVGMINDLIFLLQMIYIFFNYIKF